ncbi:ribosomal-protein-alanine acetyltransferase [Streptomyces sparsogenes DSM 40356]|uniref:Ribosomal-protein-alanine acetyltransferase n=2 Tax=Streptomyces sparsogenes TaxID=67365 RepID=A0A1R1SM15_9ACTN|nr:ribosomal-protein-alanine acetyltransferase [Streptomyces sparsogenes DSM 40356]
MVREMRWWDIERVLRLEVNLFPEDAWSPGMFWSELAHARGPAATRHYVVAEAGGRLVGYAGLAAVDRTADVQTIATARDHWGTGLGARLLTDLITAATSFECREVLLEVRVDNRRAQRLYERFGFEPIGIRKGYYQPGNVDALVMRLADPAAAAEPATPAASLAAPSPAPGSPGSVPSSAPGPAQGSVPSSAQGSVQGTKTHG